MHLLVVASLCGALWYLFTLVRFIRMSRTKTAWTAYIKSILSFAIAMAFGWVLIVTALDPANVGANPLSLFVGIVIVPTFLGFSIYDMQKAWRNVE
jgi:hypothetical protein